MKPKRVLVIIPCTKRKLWDSCPSAPSQLAAEVAYRTSTYFRACLTYALHTGDTVRVLSAKYGFIELTTPIENYNVTFKDAATGPVSPAVLRSQVQTQGLARYQVVAIGGAAYLDQVRSAFPAGALIETPFAGLTLGRLVRALREAVSHTPRRVRLL